MRWKAGDRATRVVHTGGGSAKGADLVGIGEIVMVCEVVPETSDSPGLGLRFIGKAPGVFYDGCSGSWLAGSFRKIVPLCDRAEHEKAANHEG